MPDSQMSFALNSPAAPREWQKQEATQLLAAAEALETLSARVKSGEDVSREEVTGVMTGNRRVWEAFLEEIAKPACALPREIRGEIAALCWVVFTRTIETLIDVSPVKMRLLVFVNRRFAASLLEKPLEKLVLPAPLAALAAKIRQKTAATITA